EAEEACTGTPFEGRLEMSVRAEPALNEINKRRRHCHPAAINGGLVHHIKIAVAPNVLCLVRHNRLLPWKNRSPRPTVHDSLDQWSHSGQAEILSCTMRWESLGAWG